MPIPAKTIVPPRLQAVTVRAEIVIWATAIIYLLLPFIIWLTPGLAEKLIMARMGAVLDPHALTAQARFYGWSSSMVYALPFAYGLSRIAMLFRHIRQGRAFTYQSVRCVRDLGWSLITAAILLPLTRLLVLHSVGHSAQVSQLFGAFSPGFAMLAYLTLGLALTVLSSVLKEAVRLSEENSSFI